MSGSLPLLKNASKPLLQILIIVKHSTGNKLSPELPMTLIISVAEQTMRAIEQSVAFHELDRARYKGSVRCCGPR